MSQNNFFDDNDVVEVVPAGQPAPAAKQEKFFEDHDVLEATAPAIQAAQAPKSLPNVSKTESVLRGAGQGSTLGFQDELSGFMAGQVGKQGLDEAIEDLKKGDFEKAIMKYGFAGAKKLAQNIGGLVTGKQGLSDILGERADDYSAARDEQRELNRQAEEANPKTFLAGDMGASLVVPAAGLKAVGSLGKGAQLLDKYKKLTKTQQLAAIGAEGTLEGIGRSEANNVSDVLWDGTTSGLFSAGTGGLINKVGEKFLGNVARKGKLSELPGMAQEALEDVNIHGLDALNVGKKVRTEDIVDAARNKAKGVDLKPEEMPSVFGFDKDIIGPWKNPRSMSQAASKHVVDIGNKYDEVLDRFKGTKPVKPDDAVGFADEFHNTLMNQLDDVAKTNHMLGDQQKANLLKLGENLKGEVDDAFLSDNPIKELKNIYVKYNKSFKSNAESAEVGKIVRNNIKGLQRKMIQNLDPKSAKELTKMDLDYSHALDLEDWASKNASSTGGNMNWKDFLAASTLGQVADTPIIGQAYLGANYAASKLFDKKLDDIIPAVAGKRRLQDYKNLLQKQQDMIAKGVDQTNSSKLAQGTLNTLNNIAGPAGLAGPRVVAPMIDQQAEEKPIQRTTPAAIDAHAQKAAAKGDQQTAQQLNQIAQQPDSNKRSAELFKMQQTQQKYRQLLEEQENETDQNDSYLPNDMETE